MDKKTSLTLIGPGFYGRNATLLRCVAGFLLLVMLWNTSLISARAAVTLLYFTPISNDQEVMLIWETAMELDTSGFFIQRSTQPNTGFQSINSDIIIAEGTDYSGAAYEYPDRGLVNGTEYWYRLEVINTNGQTSGYSDIVRAVVGSTPTPTSSSVPGTTVTPTATRTITPTSQSGSPTATLTNTPVNPMQPTSTPTTPSVIGQTPPATLLAPVSTTPAFFPQATLTPPGASELPPQESITNDASSVLTPTLALGPDATYAPFPTITIVFPTSSTVADPAAEPEQKNDHYAAWRLWPLGLLVVVWVGLAAWFYFSHRHLH